MQHNEVCMPMAVVFARRNVVWLGVKSIGSFSRDMTAAPLTLTEARAFRQALSRAIREAEDYVPELPAQGEETHDKVDQGSRPRPVPG